MNSYQKYIIDLIEKEKFSAALHSLAAAEAIDIYNFALKDKEPGVYKSKLFMKKYISTAQD